MNEYEIVSTDAQSSACKWKRKSDGAIVVVKEVRFENRRELVVEKSKFVSVILVLFGAWMCYLR